MSDDRKLERLLDRTSRTFALSIPLLPEPTRRRVGIAYLLFRIADTFEDATDWTPRRRIEALDEFASLLAIAAADGASGEAARSLARRWSARPPAPGHDGYRELIRETPFVLERFGALEATGRATIRRHLERTVEGMQDFVSRHGAAKRLVLESLDDLRDYCYAVAGIVGEMLTEVFLLDAVPRSLAPALEPRAARFGEGLQLVNVLRDAASDRHHGRVYLPASVDRSRVLTLAREDLSVAGDYVRALQNGDVEAGVVAFNALPVLLARATLDRVEAEGSGAKISRDEVATILAEMHEAIASGQPVVPVV